MVTRPDDVDARRGVTGAQVALIIGALLLLVILLWFLFLRGGGAEPEILPPATAPTAEPVPEETTEPSRPKDPLETFEVFAPKDPFRPLIADAGATGATTAGGTTAGVAPSPAAPGAGAPSGGSDISGDGTGTSGGGGGGGSSDSVGGHRVRLIDTFRRNGEPAARVQVDGTVYTVQEGDRFAENFKLLSVSGDCASMLFGDDEFSLCEGEEILK